MSRAQTVLGPVPVTELGPVLVHEHLNPGTCWIRQVQRGVAADDPLAVLVGELREVKQRGIDTIIDVSSQGTFPRDVDLLRRVAEATGVHIILGTGFYKEPLLPPFVHEAEVEAVARYMIDEITLGIDGTGVRAGIIGEVGSSHNRITPTEEKLLRAAAMAHKATGVPITTHCTLATMGVEQVQLLQAEGVDPARVVIGHSDLSPEPDYVETVLGLGAYVGIDTIGKQRFNYVRPESRGQGPYEALLEHYFVPDSRRLELVKHLLAAGWEQGLLFSSDIGRDQGVYDNMDTLGKWGYTYVTELFCPQLQEQGVSTDTLATILRDNPARLFGPEAGA